MDCVSLSLFLHCLLRTVKSFNGCTICYFLYVTSILNEDSFKEYVKPVVFIYLKYLP